MKTIKLLSVDKNERPYQYMYHEWFIRFSVDGHGPFTWELGVNNKQGIVIPVYESAWDFGANRDAWRGVCGLPPTGLEKCYFPEGFTRQIATALLPLVKEHPAFAGLQWDKDFQKFPRY